jgi:hypothetical protein
MLASDPIAGVPLNDPGLSMDGSGRGVADLKKMRMTADPRGNVHPGILALTGTFVLEQLRIPLKRRTF